MATKPSAYNLFTQSTNVHLPNKRVFFSFIRESANGQQNSGHPNYLGTYL